MNGSEKSCGVQMISANAARLCFIMHR